MNTNDKIFYSSLIFSLIILSLIIYVSSTQSSKEEFIELYWQVFISEDLNGTNMVDCIIENCSKSGIYKIGSINLSGINFRTIVTDLDELNEYKYTCIDFNNNDIHCEESEGPLKERDTFFVSNNGFNIFLVSEKNVIISHYPKIVSQQNFTIGFVVKSHYHSALDLNIILSVDSNLSKTRILTLKPNEEIISSFNVTLPTKGLHKVKITTMTTEGENEIDFWVNRI